MTAAPDENAVVCVGVGSNVAREDNIDKALSALRARFGPLVVSPAYESADSRFGGPSFYNLALRFASAAAPAALRAFFREVEAGCGRVQRRAKTFPLDLDLLLYGELLSDDPTLPHPEILSRAFVLKPLSDVMPDFRHPRTGKTLAWHWAHFDAVQAAALTPVAWRPRQ